MNDYLVILVGDIAVGKSCFLFRYYDKNFVETHLHTVGFDNRLKDMTLQNGKKIKLRIMDIAGHERFRPSDIKNYYKRANGFIVIYDVTNLQTYENVKMWISQIREEANPNVVIYLVGNKSDAPEKERIVKTEDGQKIADEFNLTFFETSAKDGKNVNETFECLAEKIDEVYSKLEPPKKE